MPGILKNSIAIPLGISILGQLVGCQTVPIDPLNSPFYSVPVSSRLILHKPVDIEPEQVSAWFQYGKHLPKKQLNYYYPHCKFETWTKLDTAKVVQPDTFIIHKVVRWDDYAAQPVQLAGLGLGIGFSFGGDGGPAHLNMATEMFLRSAQQPDVYRLICSHWEEPSRGNHLTISQMRQALGEWFTLQLADTDNNKDQP